MKNNDTEHKNMEALLTRKAGELSLLLNTIDTQVWYLTDIETYGQLNRAHADFLGLDVEEIAYKRLEEFLPREVAEVCKASNVEVFRTRRPVRTEEWIPDADGEERLIAITKTPKLDADGDVEYVVCAGTDVTSRIRAEEALREEHAFSESIIETAQAIILVLDTEGRIVRFNPFMEELTGWSLAEVKGKDWFETFLKAGDGLAIKPLFKKAIDDVRTRGNVNTIVAKDGREVLVEWHDKTLKDKDGNTVGLLAVGQDVTAEKEARQRFERIFYRNPSPMALTTMPDRRFFDINESFLSATGYAREEVIGKTSNDLALFPNADEQAFVADEPRSKGRASGFEIRMRRKDGTCRDILLWGDVIGSQGRELFLSLMIDITHRREMEEKLRASEAKIKTILEAFPGMLNAVDRDYHVIGASDQLLQRTGVDSIESAMGRKCYQVWKKRESICPECGVVHVLANGAPLVRHCTLDEARMTGMKSDLHVAAIRDKEGRVVGAVEIMLDMSDRLQAEEALRESEAKYRLLAENAKDVIWIRDTSLRLVFVSPSVEKVRGYTPEEAMAQTLEDALTASSARIASDFLAEVLAKGARGEETAGSHTIELEHKRKKGTPVWMESTVSLLYGQGGAPWGILGVSRDITERRKLQEARMALERRCQQVQKADSLARMAGAVAHLFNNRLAVVIGNLELLAEDLPPGIAGLKNLGEARTAAQRAAKTSGLLLTFLGQSPGKSVPLDLARACRERLADSQSDIPGSTRTTVDLPDPGPTVRADPAQLNQVFDALIVNAAEALDGDGEVRLAVRSVAAGDIPEGHCLPLEWTPTTERYACLEVADTGHGMDKDAIEKIFDPFFTSKFTGRGLGLPVALGIVNSAGGCITVDSVPGKGSVFRVFLPLSPETVAASEAPNPAAEQALAQGGTVLLVDDRETVRNIGRAMLEHLGFQVIDAGDGAEAVEIFRRRADDIRLVLTDLTMPRLNGWETLKALRDIRPDIPVILASGYDEPSPLAREQGEGPRAFLSKPYRMADLKKALARALGDTAPSDEDNRRE